MVYKNELSCVDRIQDDVDELVMRRNVSKGERK